MSFQNRNLPEENKYTKRIRNGIAGLTLLKAIDYIVPLAIIPFIVDVFGLEFYGNYVYIQTLVIFFAFISDFSLNVVGVQNIAKKKNRRYIDSYISSIFLFKITSSTLMFFVVFITLNYIVNYNFYLIYCGLLIYLGLVFQNAWYYQAKENYKPVVIFSFLGRFICFILLVLTVSNEQDKNTLYILLGLMYFIPGLLSLIYILLNHSFCKPKYRYVTHIIKDGWYVFQYRVVNASFLPFNNQIIITMVDATVLAIYNITMKGLSALVNFVTPITLSLQPVLSELYVTNRFEMESVFNKSKSRLLAISLALSLMLSVILLTYFNYYWNGEFSLDFIFLVVTLSSTLIPHCCNSLYSQVLTLSGQARYVRNVISASMFISVFFLPISLWIVPEYGSGVTNAILYFCILYFLDKKVRLLF